MNKIQVLMTKRFLHVFLILALLSETAQGGVVQAGLAALNQGNETQAEQYFEQGAAQGNAHAMYWLGNTYQLEGGIKRLDAGRILLKAAQMGDPWAMNRLDPSNNESPCSMFGWPCDSKWLDKALATWKKQAEQGDGNAELALLLRDRPWYMRFIPVLGKKMYADKLVDAFSHGSDYAAFKILHTDIKDKYTYIKKVALKGNCRAIFSYGVSLNDQKTQYLDWMRDAAKCGYSRGAEYALIFYESNQDYEKAYFYGVLGVYLGNDPTLTDPHIESWIKNISIQDRENIQKRANSYIKNNNIMSTKNYSEFSEEFFGIY
ncbi:hypothetical protein [Celerinatantimonas sp. MCCC 1A17872]|uniref:hypothetical protein n=1 Tax=Celerinatantimonas sp. MCCC 1A17872 TaxID=3177514 RepID=UPI0038CC089A